MLKSPGGSEQDHITYIKRIAIWQLRNPYHPCSAGHTTRELKSTSKQFTLEQTSISLIDLVSNIVLISTSMPTAVLITG